MLPQGSKIGRQEENPSGLTFRRGRAIRPDCWSRIPAQERGTRATKHNGAAFLP